MTTSSSSTPRLARTELISASAGTGKTHRLAEELKRELLHPTEPIAPERVIAVTFTRSAAAELAARVRRALLADGEVALARRLAAARIGTIHSVCARLVREHAFSLGLSPELHTLDEHLTLNAIRGAIEQQIPEDDRALLDELDVKLGERGVRFGWHEAVKDIIDSARGNGISAAQLAESAQRSRDELAALFPPAVDGTALEAELCDLIDKVLSGPAPKVDDVKEERMRLDELRRSLRRGEPVPWWSWVQLADSHMMVLKRFAQEHVKHPRLRADLDAAIRVVFDVATRALRRYDDDKRAWGVFDFVDQESFALKLLKDPSIKEQLREQIGLVLVDEFQDTSPLQLAILTEIAKLAKKTVFVGDQKQAIYGFRGTDPSLMESVVDALTTASQAPLDVSYRSRPGLVELTSSLFAPAFSAQGIPADRVIVTAALKRAEEPKELGPFIERWLLDDDRSGKEIAAGIVELLEDPTVYVREQGAAGGVTHVKNRHIGVLARTNKHARDIAAALAVAGVPAVLRRRGLSTTVEVRAAMAGLALFLDGRDALAAAELTRLTRGAGDPDEWLKTLVTRPEGTEPFVDDPYVAAVAKVAETQREAGLVLALDLVIEALRLRDCCASWGDTAQRLANLGALRALAVRFVEERGARGVGATIPGFLARLEELAASSTDDRVDDPDDEQGDVAGQDAVDVVTWHKAKGREWPIVVLAQLVYQRPPRVTGVHVTAGDNDASLAGTRVDLEDPLKGRWVRYWPSPYGDWQQQGGLLDVLASHPYASRLEREALREELRLLYVGWTRARDRLILPGSVADPSMGASKRYDLWLGSMSMLRHLVDAKGPMLNEPVVASPDGKGQGLGSARWAGHVVDVVVRKPRARPPAPPSPGERVVHAPLPPRVYAPAFAAPSSLAEVGELVGEPVSIGAPVGLPSFPDEDTMALLGTAVHNFYAADPAAPDPRARTSLLALPDIENTRYRLAERLLFGYGVRALMQPADLVASADRLWAHVVARWPGSTLRREAPVAHRLPEGTLVRGIIDLVVAHSHGYAIVDHKTYAGIVPRELAPAFAGQLRAYGRALQAATAKPVTELVVHFPLSAAMVTVR